MALILLDGGASLAGVVDGQGVELDDLAGCCGFSSFGQSPGVRAVAARGAGGFTPQSGDGGDGAVFDERFEDATDGALGASVSLSSQHDGELGLAPCRVVGARLVHRLDQRRRPCRPAQMVGAS